MGVNCVSGGFLVIGSRGLAGWLGGLCCLVFGVTSSEVDLAFNHAEKSATTGYGACLIRQWGASAPHFYPGCL
jgi:hypothetical protein